MSIARVPTVSDILKDSITALASQHWPVQRSAVSTTAVSTTPVKTTGKKKTHPKSSGKGKIPPISNDATSVQSALFSNELVVQIFESELSSSNNLSRIQLLELSCYLENYIWPHFSENASFEHVLSIILMVNEKCREGVPAFEFLTTDPEKFDIFFKAVVLIWLDRSQKLSYLQKSIYTQFLINVYLSLENAVIRRCCLQYLSLPIWNAMSSDRLSAELDQFPPLAKHWQHLMKEKGKSTILSADSPAGPPASSGKKRGRQSVGSATKSKKSKVEAVHGAVELDGAPILTEQWVPQLIDDFLHTVEDISSADDISERELYVCRFLEFVLDLLSQLPTRRFLNALLDDLHFVFRLKRAAQWTDVKLFQRLTFAVDDLMHFEIQDQTGKALTPTEVMAAHLSRLQTVQEMAHKYHAEALRDLIFSSTGELGKGDFLRKYLSGLDSSQLLEFAVKCRILSRRDVQNGLGGSLPVDAPIALTAILEKLCHRKGQLDSLNQSALYPTEKDLWDENILPGGGFRYSGESVLALPKLNLQFLTMLDYLVRNYTLFKLESSYEIRQDLVDAVKRMAPKQPLPCDPVSFCGWARMAMPTKSFAISMISKASIGDVFPREVRAVVELDLSRFTGDIRAEWEQLKEHDVIFLLSIQSPEPAASSNVDEYRNERRELAAGRKPRSNRVSDLVGASIIEDNEFDFPKIFGVQYVRGAEIIEMKDEDDVVLNDFTRPDERNGGRSGHKRTLLIRLDPAQYYADMKNSESCYESLNLVVRRKAKENNFRSVLDTIRSLINMEAIGRAVPSWLYDVILGYGNPDSAHYRNMPSVSLSQLSPEVVATVASIKHELGESADDYDEIFDYVDTFTSADHVTASFPNADVTFRSDGNSVSDPSAKKKSKASIKENASAVAPPYLLFIKRGVEGARDQIDCVGYKQLNKGPYLDDTPPVNTVRFSDIQVEAIRSGINKGLTLVVGPPGTGKTDVAVQIIVNLYHNFPTQKILLVTHSNAALNDLFLKIMQRDVDQRHLLRLGSGEQSLTLDDEKFSKQGRVDWSLARRLQLLGQIQRLAETLQIVGDVGYTCETAEYFYLEHVEWRIEKCRREMTTDDIVDVAKVFPFTEFFSDSPKVLFDGSRADIESAEGCFMHINKIFQELKDYRAFELLRTQGHRADYLLTKQARIVAMTCTHAAMMRSRLVELGFKYDSLVMEEAAQILEVETLIPMLLQNTDEIDGCRLKRVVMIGDHNQLPPVVKHPAFQKHSKLDQSMFTRLIRLGVPRVQLDRQGRARAEIAALYSWRYQQATNSLGNFAFITDRNAKYAFANAGFVYNFQLINVADFKGKGEFCPTPYFYQNLGEAEYVVAVYQYMRLLGYPAKNISIITPYNGQKNLIRDVLAQRCNNDIFGFPAAVTTVDKYQGQQNDFVLLSLVRTESVGHMRDVRRLVVALSRARFGLYVFCRQALFENCYELSPAFSQLSKRPAQLLLVAGEGYPCTRPSFEGGVEIDSTLNVHAVSDVTDMGVLVYQMVQQAQHTASTEQMDTSG